MLVLGVSFLRTRPFEEELGKCITLGCLRIGRNVDWSLSRHDCCLFPVRLTRMNVEAPLEKLSKVFGGFSGPRGDVIGLHVNSHLASRSSPDVPPRRFLVIGDRQRRLNYDSGVPVDLPALNHQTRLKYQAVPYLRRRKLAVQKRLLQVLTANFQIRERLGRNMNQLNFLGSFSIVVSFAHDFTGLTSPRR